MARQVPSPHSFRVERVRERGGCKLRVLVLPPLSPALSP
jgi:hypothetical protein